MDNNPFFSVVIPTYNRAQFIRKTIDSVLAQTYLDFEIIVVDDGSTDNTEDVIRSIQNDKIRYYKKENAERGAARNFGADLANGKFINFLDSDDVLYNNHLEVAFGFLLKNDETVIFHLGYDVKDEEGDILRKVSNIDFINQRILSGNILSCNAIFIRKDILLQNRFNEDRVLSSLEDWELWIRMSSRFPFLNNNTITSTVVQHDNRSVMQIDSVAIKRKVERFIHYVLADSNNKAHFGSTLNKAIASANTYAALHLIIAGGEKMEVLQYLWRGITNSPSEIFTKRFLVIIKKVIGF
ncbi:MAG: glycosyltransferase [Cyclobacteriaceae bacterium]|nr:glycosyltransferase [Cyclobacteriaceae bacterium]